MLMQQEKALQKQAAERQEREATGQPPPMLTKAQVNHAYDILEQQRFGPYLVKYGCLSSVGAIAYTYLRGFYHLSMKNREAWVGTFRHRLFILGPVISAYAAANGMLPLPFKDRIEEALDRRAICMYDIVTAKATVRKAQELPLSVQA